MCMTEFLRKHKRDRKKRCNGIFSLHIQKSDFESMRLQVQLLDHFLACGDNQLWMCYIITGQFSVEKVDKLNNLHRDY